MTELKAAGAGDAPPSYMIFLVVFLFFLTGLLGFLICHLLKKKGYRCRTGDMEDEEEEENLGENEDDENDENQDTVEQILKCIIENEANMEAFNEMLGNHNVCVRHDPRLRKESIGGVPPHLHTVHSGSDHNSCLLCAQVQSKKGRRQSRTPRFKQRPGEQTVFSVGRFRVTHTDKKLHGGPNPLAISGDQLDQSQDSEERKEGGYILRSMFKEEQLPSDGANGIAASTGKQKKNVTMFGLRRGSDPLGLKPKNGKVRDARVKLAFQQPPLVLEEPLKEENTGTGFEHSTKPGSKPKSEPTTAQYEDKTSVNSPSIQSKKQSGDSSPSLQEGSQTGLKDMVQTSSWGSAAPFPTSLPGLSDRRVNVDEMLKTEEADITGPVQTSTPISLIPATSSGFSASRSTVESQLYANKDLLVAPKSSDPCSSPDQKASIGAGVAVITLGSSPHKSLLSISSLKGHTSSLNESTSPRSSSRNVSSESAKTPADQNLDPTNSSLPTLELEHVRPVTATTAGSSDTRSGSGKELKSEGDMILKTNGKTAGTLEPDLKGSGLFSPPDQSCKEGPISLPLSPSSSLFSSSPRGSRTNSAAIVKASPDSKIEFSVVTVLEDEDSSSSVRHQKKETSGDDFKPERRKDSQNEIRESTGAEVRSCLGQEKEDLVEMEDIRHCKVTQVGGAYKEKIYTQKSPDQEGESPIP
uniref:RELT-like 2 n=1 Tax=Iconisemion striatum TaxID=60296 RepID=A0A1A7YZ89_9TELE